MNAEAPGLQAHNAKDTNPQVNDRQSASDPQELTPDRPPQAIEGQGETKRRRGFAAMDRKLVSEIARKGGKAAHSAGTAHEFTSEEARVAGQKGGRATHAKRRKGGEQPEDRRPQSEKPGV
jgi:general stress protein YciG